MKRVRIVCYAINGRGMGHLVRQLAILRQARRLCALMGVELEPWVLTSSEADTLARREGVPALKMPSKAMLRDAGLAPERYLAIARTWVLNAVAGLAPDVLVVDTFPGGSFGELVPVLDLAPARVLVARRVRDAIAADDAYAPLVPLYDRVVSPDDRDVGPILLRERAELRPRAEARRILGVPDGQRAVYVTLGGGGDVAAAGTLPRLVDALRDRGWHVVVGSGPLYTGPERRGPGITWLSRYTPAELLTGVDAAVSAAGYNSFHELMQAGVPTVFLPQPRISDDQAGRAQRAVEAGAARLAPTVDAVPDLLEDPGDPDACRSLVPQGGARRAAAAILSEVLPRDRVSTALDALTDDLLRLTAALDHGALSRKALELVGLLAGQGAAGVDRVLALCRTLDLSVDDALAVVGALRRTFPLADGPALVAAAELLLPAWARFDDWMGALALLRAVPTQRTYPVDAFAEATAAWLAGEEDLFEATAAFSRLEARGARTVPEVLHLLRQADGPGAEVVQ